MTKNKAIQLAASLFKHYPAVDDFYFTTDEQAFASKTDAESHADFLDKKKPVVIPVNREDKETKEVKELSARQLAEKNVADGKQLVNKATTALGKAKTDEAKTTAQTALDIAEAGLKTAQEELAAIAE